MGEGVRATSRWQNMLWLPMHGQGVRRWLRHFWHGGFGYELWYVKVAGNRGLEDSEQFAKGGLSIGRCFRCGYWWLW